MKRKYCLIGLVFLLIGCSAPKHVPSDINKVNTVEKLAKASQEAYRQAKIQTQKSAKIKYSQEGIAYSDRCLKAAPKEIACLYYNVLNRGIFIKNHFPGYQKSLKRMVAHCETLNQLEPSYENAGCYRILGNIYSKVPSFSLSSDGVTRDLDKSEEYLKKAVQLAPDYSLNHLFLARVLEEQGKPSAAKSELAEFDRLLQSNLDSEYPEWKKERESLGRKLN